MHNEQSSLFLQLLQSLNEGDNIPVDPQFAHLPSPFNTLAKIRPMLPPREQLLIDLMIKFHEITVLMDKIQATP